MPRQKLGPFLRAARMRKGVSQVQLARAIGVRPSYLCEVEKGDRRGLKVPALEKAAHYLRLDLVVLLVRAGVVDDGSADAASVVGMLRCQCGRRRFTRARARDLLGAVAVLSECVDDLEGEAKDTPPSVQRLVRTLRSQLKELRTTLFAQ